MHDRLQLGPTFNTKPPHNHTTTTPITTTQSINQQTESTRFKFGYLTKQNAAWAALGVNVFGSKFSPADLVKEADELLVVAYPSFNPREELAATAALWRGAGEGKGR